MAAHSAIDIDEARATTHLMDLLGIPGPSGGERRVSCAVAAKLRDAGCKSDWIRSDDAHRRIGRDFETGNLIVRMPGTRSGRRLLLCSHMDTVPLCRGAKPVRKGNRIVPAGHTGLGADNRTAVACLVTLVETLLKDRIPHPPLTLLFTVGEELGLLGAKAVRKPDLGSPRMGFNIDSGAPAEFLTAAIGARRWEVEILGRSAHAGVHPEDGVSAILIAARAIRDVAARGFFGRIRKGRNRGTSNVGRMEGGEATNQVTDRVQVVGECRSHDSAFLEDIVEVYRDAFQRAAASVRNAKGRKGKVRFRAYHDYAPFILDRTDDVVIHACRAAAEVGLRSSCKPIDGGLDANCLNGKGIPTVTFGAGQHCPHTVDEYVDLREFADGCRLAVALVSLGL